MLLALTAIGDEKDALFQLTARRLIEILEDYSGPAMLSSQRRFLMSEVSVLTDSVVHVMAEERFARTATGSGFLETLDADRRALYVRNWLWTHAHWYKWDVVLPTIYEEQLSAGYVAAEPDPVEPDKFGLVTPVEPEFAFPTEGALLSGTDWEEPIYRLGVGGRIVALYSQNWLVQTCAARVGMPEGVRELGENLHVTFGLPGEHGQSPHSVRVESGIVSVPVSGVMPGWWIVLYSDNRDHFSNAADRRVTVYLWSGVTAVMLIALAGVAAGGYIGRQIRLARLKNDLLATVSHELKTPLASMRVFVDTLLENRYEDEDKAREYLRLVAKENERLSRLIDNFLAFSRMERRKTAFDFVGVDVREVVETAVDSMTEKCRRPGCALDVHLPDELPTIVGDRDALVTVLVNLLDNAWKYTGETKQIDLGVTVSGASLKMSVSDNGSGISRRDRKRIFKRFYQVDRTLSREGGGCGLGLAIVKFIVDSHGGEIEVESRPGKGSTFTVSLPLEAKCAQTGRQEAHS
ncbi:MAG: sensor histidine kinase [Planctomycetota bacterium]|jgi:signal transduction histidine kinase